MKILKIIHEDLVTGLANDDFNFDDACRMMRKFIMEVRIVNAENMFRGDVDKLRELETSLDAAAKVCLNVTDDIMTDMYGVQRKKEQ